MLIEQLNDTQLKSFDREFIKNKRWETIKRYIERDFPDGCFTFMDIGGGNGNFADRVLGNWPKSQGVVLDNSRLLLNKNKPNSRKTLLFDSVENLESHAENKFDLVTLNLVLHHVVARASYSRCLDNISGVLRSVRTILSERGRVSVFEQMYIGLFLDVAPSWIIYQLTSHKTMANIIRKCGANTAGIGVCFLTYKQWCSVIQRIGFRFEYTEDGLFPVPWTWRSLLHVRRLESGCFWLSPSAIKPQRADSI
ncbi:MAG: hypothetical protein A2162_08595 [Deltaproteobacteria bacterium RBG_13_52_11b]|nr:MAG: hypothetical protein A2162_08595 [Deltaproteobacteria bacterium RBG_13_52_11b]